MEEAIAIVKKYRDNVLGGDMCSQIERAVLNSIIEDLEAAQHRVQPTVLTVRHKLVTCPQCLLVFDGNEHATHSG